MFKRLLIWLGLAKEETPVTVIGKGEKTNPIPEGTKVEKPAEPINRIGYMSPAEVPWIAFAKTKIGKKETDDAFAKEMIPFWKRLFGRNIDAIAGNNVAWCGLFVARCLSEAGMSWQKHGEMAGNWREYGVPINWKRDGIPQGAIIHINHSGDCGKGSKGNHVTFAATDHSADDISRGYLLRALGGNQGNKVCVALYSTKEICEVRWPKEYAFPAPVTATALVDAEMGGVTT